MPACIKKHQLPEDENSSVSVSLVVAPGCFQTLAGSMALFQQAKKKRLQFLLEIVTVSKNPCLQKTSRPISVLQKLGGHIHHDRHPLLCRDKTAGIL